MANRQRASRPGVLATTFPDSLTRPDLLYDAYYAEAVLLAYRILWDPRDAEDVAQECFLAVWRARQSYDRTKGSTRTWLLSIVRNRAIDLLRAQHRRPALRLEANFDTADKVDVAGEAAVHVDAEIARQALTDLPPAQRQVLELAYFEGLTQVEIASRLLISLGTVKSRIRLGLDRLRTNLRLVTPAFGVADAASGSAPGNSGVPTTGVGLDAYASGL